jgi:small subunit ribosomal protein S1
LTTVEGIEPQANIEDELEQRLRGVRLVLEVGLDADTVARVREVAAAVAGRSSDPEWLLATQLPAVLVTFLVADGVDFYDGSFWPRLSVRGLDGTKLGQGFERAIRTLDLEPFDDLVDDNALRYVAPILAHGGIPKYSTRDYLRLVSRELRRHTDASAEELVALWRSRRTAFVDIDTPVRRFLVYGGGAALDLLDRTIELLKLGADDVQLGVAERLGLPRHLIETYLALGPDRAGLAASPGARLPRPAVRFDPWGGLGPVVELPSVATRFRGAAWRVAGDGRSRVFDASLLDSQVVPVDAAGAWEVTFEEAGGLHRDYAFECLGESPIVCFDPASGDYVADTRPIALDEIWALVPDGTELSGLRADGATAPLTQVAELPKPAGSWTGFQAVHLSLSGVRAVTVRLDTPGAEQAATGLIRVIRPTDRPALTGKPLSNVIGVYGDPVFAAVPALRVPIIAGFGDDRWTLRVKGSEAELDATLADFERVGDIIALPEHEALSFGAVDVSLRGPLGSDLRARFVVVPGLSVEVPDRILLPTDTAPAFVTASASAGIELGGGHSSDSARIAIPSSGAEVPLIARLGNTEVALRVAVPRLQWGAKKGESVPTLSGQRIAIDRDDIESGATESLVVATHRGHVAMALELWADRGLIQQTAFVTSSERDGRWVFDLGHFRDTVRAELTARLQLKLAIATDLVVVADVVAGVMASDFSVALDDDDPASTTIAFSQARSLLGRVARLWSLQRPWEAPISLAIPDAAAGSFVVPGTVASPGRYRVEITVDDPWTAPMRPRAGASSTADLVVGSAAADLARRVELETAGPVGLLEFAVVNGIWPREFQGPSVAEVAGLALDGAAAMLADLEAAQTPPRSLQVLAGIALADLQTALDGVASRFSEERLDQQTVLSIVLLSIASTRLVVPPVVSERVMRTIWQACPPLASLVDVPSARAGDAEASDRCGQFLGWRPGQEADIRPGMRLTELELKPPQLRLVRERLGLVPREVLSWDSWALASFDWLLAAREQDGIQHWWNRNGWLAAASFDDDAELSSDVRSRSPQRHPDAWAAFPQATLAAAFHITRNDSERSAAAEALRAAIGVASRLVVHDLCLARVVVSAAQEAELADGASGWPDVGNGHALSTLGADESALGSVVTGRVVKLVDGGAYVRVGPGPDAFLNERSFLRDVTGSAIAPRVGDLIEALVVALDSSSAQVRLSQRAIAARDLAAAIEVGAIVEGVVESQSPAGTFVDVAGISAFLPDEELSWRRSERVKPQVGAAIRATVSSVEPALGRVKLSVRRLTDDPNLAFIRSLEIGQHLAGTVAEVSDLGLFVTIGPIEGLVYASHLPRLPDGGRDRNFAVGQHVSVEVFDLKPEQGQIGLSMRSAERAGWESATEGLKVGLVVPATIVRIGSAGLFVNVLGAFGLIHRSEVAWTRLEDLESTYHLGQTVDALVIGLDAETMRLTLSMKRLAPDPWEGLDTALPPGTSVTGIVTKLTNFGAFVRLDLGIDALAHITELSEEPLGDTPPLEYVERQLAPGQQITARVLDVNSREHRLSLSLR